jgi:hypothetical protein
VTTTATTIAAGAGEVEENMKTIEPETFRKSAATVAAAVAVAIIVAVAVAVAVGAAEEAAAGTVAVAIEVANQDR